MEILGIQRTEDIQNIQIALKSINPIKVQIDRIIKENKDVDMNNEMVLSFLNSAKENLDQAVTELSCALSDIIGIDVRKYYLEENK